MGRKRTDQDLQLPSTSLARRAGIRVAQGREQGQGKGEGRIEGVMIMAKVAAVDMGLQLAVIDGILGSMLWLEHGLRAQPRQGSLPPHPRQCDSRRG